MMIPPTRCSSSSRRWTMMRSCRGLTFMVLSLHNRCMEAAGRSNRRRTHALPAGGPAPSGSEAAVALSTHQARLPIIVWARPKSSRAGSASLAFQAVLGELPAERVAVNAQRLGGPAHVEPGARQHPRDVPPLELPQGVRIADSLGDHLVDQPLQLFSHPPP